MPLTIVPLTPARWPALADLFGTLGACNGCWCMYWRVGAAYRTAGAARNKRAFHRVVAKGPPPGLLALDGALAVGWCQITPRASLPHLAKPWRLAPVDDLPVWSISCLYVRKGHRRRGITRALITAAVGHARRAGAPAVEAYPLDKSVSPSATGTGYATTFKKLGFEVVALRAPERPIMRLDLR